MYLLLAHCQHCKSHAFYQHCNLYSVFRQSTSTQQETTASLIGTFFLKSFILTSQYHWKSSMRYSAIITCFWVLMHILILLNFIECCHYITLTFVHQAPIYNENNYSVIHWYVVQDPLKLQVPLNCSVVIIWIIVNTFVEKCMFTIHMFLNPAI